MCLNNVLVLLYLFAVCRAKYVDDVEDYSVDGMVKNIYNNILSKYKLRTTYDLDHNRNEKDNTERNVDYKTYKYNENDVQIIMKENVLKRKENTENDERMTNENKNNKFNTVQNLIPSLVSILNTRGISTAVLEIVPVDIENTLDVRRMFEEVSDLRRDQNIHQHHLPKRFTVKQNAVDVKFNEYQNNNDYYVALLKSIWKIWPFSIQAIFENFLESTEDNTSIGEDLNRENRAILRDVCEDCIKAQVKKCYKAVKDIPKRSCNIYYCKSEFKSKFKDNSKTVCLKEFWGEEEKKKRYQNTTIVNKKKNPRDMTRVGFDCDVGVYDLKKFERKESGHDLESLVGTNLNVLREKHERACQKALSKKCIAACKKVIQLTCDSYKCLNGQKKMMKKDCKKECKNTFVKSKSSESGDSSKSSDEQTDDEESTDSD